MYDPTHKSDERMAPGGATQASAVYAEVESYFSVKDVAQLLRKWLWVIILVALTSVGAAVAFSLWQTPVYQASAKLLVGQKQGEVQQLNLIGTVEGLQQLTHTMVEAVNSRPVAREVIQRLGLQMAPEDLLDNLTIEQIEDTQFLLLSYRDTDPVRAQKIVNSVSDVSSERISEANASANNITVTVWESATVPDTPVSPDPVRNGLLALGLGLMLGTGLAFLLEYFDNS